MSAIQQVMASFKKPPYTEYAFFDSFGFNSGSNPGNVSATTLDPSGSPSSAIGRTNLGKSSGKWYWEVRIGTQEAINHIGIGRSTFPMNIYPGYVAGSIAWNTTYNRTLWNEGATSTYGTYPPAYAVIGVALDMDAGTLTYFVNNVSQGVAVAGLTGTWYGLNGVAASSPPGSITLISGPTTTYAPPAGHSLMSTYYP